MQETVILEVPVKRYIKKYLEKKMSLPLQMTTLHDGMRIFLYHLLREQKEDLMYRKFVNNFSEKIEVEISHRYLLKERVRHITYRNVNLFHNYVDELMRMELLYFVLMNKNFGVNKKISIGWFMEQFGINDTDFSYDAAIKYVQRKERSTNFVLPQKNEL